MINQQTTKKFKKKNNFVHSVYRIFLYSHIVFAHPPSHKGISCSLLSSSSMNCILFSGFALPTGIVPFFFADFLPKKISYIPIFLFWWTSATSLSSLDSSVNTDSSLKSIFSNLYDSLLSAGGRLSIDSERPLALRVA